MGSKYATRGWLIGEGFYLSPPYLMGEWLGEGSWEHNQEVIWRSRPLSYPIWLIWGIHKNICSIVIRIARSYCSPILPFEFVTCEDDTILS